MCTKYTGLFGLLKSCVCVEAFNNEMDNGTHDINTLDTTIGAPFVNLYGI